MKISEKMLEDWICEHPEEIFGMELLGRQIRLRHGILDVLGYRPDIWKTTPIELKARPLEEKDIGQVLRYSYDISCLINSAWIEMGYPEYFDEEILPQRYHDITSHLLADYPKTYRDDIFERLLIDDWRGYCSPMLIGPSVDDATFASARGAEIVVLLWRYDQGTFWLDLPDNELNPIERDIPKWTQWAVRHHIDYVEKEATRIVDENVNPLLLGL